MTTVDKRKDMAKEIGRPSVDHETTDAQQYTNSQQSKYEMTDIEETIEDRQVESKEPRERPNIKDK